jgi:hypothetical protein
MKNKGYTVNKATWSWDEGVFAKGKLSVELSIEKDSEE